MMRIHQLDIVTSGPKCSTDQELRVARNAPFARFAARTNGAAVIANRVVIWTSSVCQDVLERCKG